MGVTRKKRTAAGKAAVLVFEALGAARKAQEETTDPADYARWELVIDALVHAGTNVQRLF